MLTPHGEHNPAAIDPADYPHKVLLDGPDPDGDTAIFWFDRDPLPFADDVIETMQAVLARGGSILLMARCPDVLARTEAVALMLAESIYRPGERVVS